MRSSTASTKIAVAAAYAAVGAIIVRFQELCS
jgi:hypothetical protein